VLKLRQSDMFDGQVAFLPVMIMISASLKANQKNDDLHDSADCLLASELADLLVMVARPRKSHMLLLMKMGLVCQSCNQNVPHSHTTLLQHSAPVLGNQKLGKTLQMQPGFLCVYEYCRYRVAPFVTIRQSHPPCAQRNQDQQLLQIIATA